jgi:hypothetical protein
MDIFSDFCRVKEDGLAHLFVGLEYGAGCACSRKFIALAADDERVRPGDVPWDATLRLLPCIERHCVAYEVEMLRTDVLLARGAREIRRAHTARVSAGATRNWTHSTRRRAERLRRYAIAARRRRGPLSGSGPGD